MDKACDKNLMNELILRQIGLQGEETGGKGGGGG